MIRIIFCCFRMSPENLEMLHSWIGPKIKKVTKKMRELDDVAVMLEFPSEGAV